MAGILDPGDQRIVSRLLNDVNDPSPGVPLSTANASGSIIQPYFGMVGKRLVLTAAMAAKLSDTAIGTLFEGIYQYVQFKTGVTAPAIGALAYWDDYENYIVTSVPGTSRSPGIPTSDNTGLFAGVYLNTATAGNYGFIQIAGKCTMKMKATMSKVVGTISAGDLVLEDATPGATGDVINNASPITAALAKIILGVSINTPTSTTVSTLVDLWNLRQVFGGLGGF